MHYTAAAIQAHIIDVTPSDPSALRRNAEHMAGLIAGLAETDPELRLVVLPEHCLTGCAPQRSAADWAEVGLRFDGPEFGILRDAARRHGVHLAGASYEYDPATPGRFWNTGFLIGPAGDLLLTTRKHSPDLLQGGTAASHPADDLGEARADVRRLFPTVDTEIGRLGVIVGEDLLYPEYARGLVFNGAELLLHPNAERNDELAVARLDARYARAWENLAYLVTASPGGWTASNGVARTVAAGEVSAIYNYRALLLAAAEGGGEAAVTATIDLDELRQRRADPHVNFPAQLRTQLYAAEYEREHVPGGRPVITAHDRGYDLERAREVIERMEAAGVWPAIATAPKPYDVIMVQGTVLSCYDVALRDHVIQDNLERTVTLASGFARSPKTKLVVFPEYWLQGAAFGKSVDDFWPIVGIRVPHSGETVTGAFPELHRLAEFAAQMGVYVSGAVFEFDPEWPRRWFNTAFIISPQGALIHKYRKIQCADVNGMLSDTTPGNVYSQYLERYGEDGIFPVVQTEIGNLATCICFDNNFPELWRSLGMRGAEVICYPTGEPHNQNRPGWERAKRAHAAENQFYIASANSGQEQRAIGGPLGTFHRGHSRLVGFDGSIVVAADGPGDVALVGTIDIGALRKARHDPRKNLMASLDQRLVQPVYRDTFGYPLDCFLDNVCTDAAEGLAFTQQTVERYFEAGIFTRPGQRVPSRTPATFVGV